MSQKVRLFFLLMTIFAVLAVTTGPAYAQDGTPPAETGDIASAPFEGSGVLPEGMKAMKIPSYAGLKGMSATPESVIGADGRVQVANTTLYPSRAIAYLIITFPNSAQYTCTGWFIGPRSIATAAHCIYSAGDGGYLTNADIYPGANGVSAPYGFTTMHKRWVPAAWLHSAPPNYDYGVMQTNDALGSTVGWFGYRWQASDVFPGVFAVRGYPGDKPAGTMWSMGGAITYANTYHLWDNIDTYGGQSGSPLYQKFNGTCCYGVGIHTYGANLPPYTGNSATRITRTVFSNMTKWKNAAYP